MSITSVVTVVGSGVELSGEGFSVDLGALLEAASGILDAMQVMEAWQVKDLECEQSAFGHEGLAAAGEGLKRIDTGDGWKGNAADKFREAFDGEPKRWIISGDAFHDAAAALISYAGTLEWAQGDFLVMSAGRCGKVGRTRSMLLPLLATLEPTIWKTC